MDLKKDLIHFINDAVIQGGKAFENMLIKMADENISKEILLAIFVHGKTTQLEFYKKYFSFQNSELIELAQYIKPEHIDKIFELEGTQYAFFVLLSKLPYSLIECDNLKTLYHLIDYNYQSHENSFEQLLCINLLNTKNSNVLFHIKDKIIPHNIDVAVYNCHVRFNIEALEHMVDTNTLLQKTIYDHIHVGKTIRFFEDNFHTVFGNDFNVSDISNIEKYFHKVIPILHEAQQIELLINYIKDYPLIVNAITMPFLSALNNVNSSYIDDLLLLNNINDEFKNILNSLKMHNTLSDMLPVNGGKTRKFKV